MAALGDGSDEGSGLPTIIGTGTKIAETSVMKDLFGRSFKAVGDYYGEQVEEFFQKRREKRLKNVSDHEKRVAQVIGEPVEVLSRPDRGREIERWVDAAADVPVEDTERAAVLEAVLAQIFTNRADPDFQDAVERLSSSGMRLLLNAPSNKSFAPEGDDRQEFERLRSLGLARTLDLRKAAALVFAWLIGSAAGLFFLSAVVPAILRRQIAIEFMAEAIIVSAVLSALGVALLSTKYQLTEFGRALQESALRFYSDRVTLRKLKFLSLVPSRPIIWGALAALIVSAASVALESYLPAQLRTDYRSTIVISAPPAGPSQTTSPPVTPASAPASSPQRTTLTADEIGTLIDVWRSVSGQMNEITAITNSDLALISNWPQTVKDNADGFSRDLLQKRNSINERRTSLQSLLTAYQHYPNVAAALSEVSKDEVFGRLYRALDSFSHEVHDLTVPPPSGFEEKLRPYAGELKRASDVMARWANNTRTFALRQSDELSLVKSP